MEGDAIRLGTRVIVVGRRDAPELTGKRGVLTGWQATTRPGAEGLSAMVRFEDGVLRFVAADQLAIE